MRGMMPRLRKLRSRWRIWRRVRQLDDERREDGYRVGEEHTARHREIAELDEAAGMLPVLRRRQR